MNSTQFDVGFQLLCDNFEKEFRTQVRFERKRRLWFDRLRDVPDQYFRSAVDYIIENQDRFPSLASIWSAINRVRSETIQRESETDRIRRLQAEYEANPPNPLYEQEAKETVAMIMKGGPCYDLMMAMDEKWPGRGWKEGAERYLERSPKHRYRVEVKEIEDVTSLADVMKEEGVTP